MMCIFLDTKNALKLSRAIMRLANKNRVLIIHQMFNRLRKSVVLISELSKSNFNYCLLIILVYTKSFNTLKRLEKEILNAPISI